MHGYSPVPLSHSALGAHRRFGETKILTFSNKRRSSTSTSTQSLINISPATTLALSVYNQHAPKITCNFSVVLVLETLQLTTLYSGHESESITMAAVLERASYQDRRFLALLTAVFLLFTKTTYDIGLLSLALQNQPLSHASESWTETTTTPVSPPISSQYALAYRDSFGFFDDIRQVDWQRLQQRVHSTPLFKSPFIKSERQYTTPADFMMMNVDPVFSCLHLRRVGGLGDGPKYVCDPHRLVKRQDCLIYSFGSNGKYEFEDALAHDLHNHCEIHVFDPSPSFARDGDAERNNIHFHAWGLRSSYHPTEQFGGFHFLSLPEILEKLGHVGKRIDIFKIDCEGCEWSTYQDWISDTVDIRQLLVETHASRQRIPQLSLSKFYGDLYAKGFVPYSKEANTLSIVKPPGECFEYSFIKLAPTFFAKNETVV